jgi:hypothetical protein
MRNTRQSFSRGQTARRPRRGAFAVAILLSLLIALLGTPALAQPPGPPAYALTFDVEVVSSAPDQVTGGDSRLHIQVPANMSPHQVEVTVNGVDQSGHFSLIPGTRTLTGVVDGLALGENTVVVRPTSRSRGRPAEVTLELVNHPITGPVFSGPQQYPFVCQVQSTVLGQPLVDNETEGYPVYGNMGAVIGYSKDCSVETLVQYVYRSTKGGFKRYTPGGRRPTDMAQTTTLDGLTVDYIVRWERGTINRFIYSLAVLAPYERGPKSLEKTAWNGRLIYHFEGGVAIGHDQGNPSASRMLYEPGLSRGYAVAYSTGTRTGTHYNLVVGGETALMVKERFVELYDVPLYTVGLGGSGGAIQQYIYGQNHEGLLDAAIPQYSYPDMVSQAVHVGDCELLEYYMDVLDGANSRWQTWSDRALIEGLNASDTVENPYTGQDGASECVIGWRGLSPLAINPHYGYVVGQEDIVPPSAVEAIEWSHFADLVNVLGTADDGYARRYWDNVGVQYGLQAVATGAITPDEFLNLNASVGGWKEEPEMVQEACPFWPRGCSDPENWDPWSARNQVFSADPSPAPAPRTEGDREAMREAYRAGLVFRGDIDMPIIDWRHYLEDHLDMHNSHQSFAARQRIRNFRGDSDNQVIWFTDVGLAGPEFDQTPEALEVMDQWMANILADPAAGVAGNKPPGATDRCFDKDGIEIAAGDGVWDGILDGGELGTCAARFPVYGTSRTVAGGPFEQSIFKCQLMPVARAIAQDLYGVWTPTAAERDRLEEIFPDGVCDYTKKDAGLPPGW